MDIETLIKEDLWQEIKGLYNSGHYSNAVFETVKYLSRAIREKTGLDGDGVNLVIAALGGEEPKLKVNKLQTQTEKDVQRGMFYLLQGIYLSLKNPRSHEKQIDNKENADAEILFIDYLLTKIDLALSSFTIPDFISRINDDLFVQEKGYAKAMVDEIPNIKLYDTLGEAYRSVRQEKEKNFSLILHELITRLSATQKKEFLTIVSNNLKTTSADWNIRLTFQILEPSDWKYIDKTPKLRIENQILKSISDGRCTWRAEMSEGSSGALGTWACEFLEHFESNLKARAIIINKLKGDYEEKLYIFSYFLSLLPDLFNKSITESGVVLKLINNAISSDEFPNDQSLKAVVRDGLWMLPELWIESILSAHPDLVNDIEEIPF